MNIDHQRASDLSEAQLKKLDLQDLVVLCRIGRTIHVSGTGRGKQYQYYCGVKTPCGEIEQSVWLRTIKAIVKRPCYTEEYARFRDWLTKRVSFLQYYSAENRELYIYDCFASRLFDNPKWIDYLAYQRRYHPETARAVEKLRVISPCCHIPYDIPAQIYTKYSAHACPACGRLLHPLPIPSEPQAKSSKAKRHFTL